MDVPARIKITEGLMTPASQTTDRDCASADAFLASIVTKTAGLIPALDTVTSALDARSTSLYPLLEDLRDGLDLMKIASRRIAPSYESLANGDIALEALENAAEFAIKELRRLRTRARRIRSDPDLRADVEEYRRRR
jgi:hypothetical protein